MSRVFVCGLPGSGNRIFKKLIEAAGGWAHVAHGVPFKPEWLDKGGFHGRRCAEVIEWGGPTSILIPVRSRQHRAKTYLGRKDKFYDWCHKYSDVEMISRVVNRAFMLQMPVRHVSYEAFVANPACEGDALLAELGLEPVGDEWYSQHVVNGDQAQEDAG